MPFKDDELKRAAQAAAALSDPSRLKIVALLTEKGSLNVGNIAEITGIPMVNASHHLSVLKTAGLLVDERVGRTRVYSLDQCFKRGSASFGPLTLTVNK